MYKDLDYLSSMAAVTVYMVKTVDVEPKLMKRTERQRQ